MALPAHTPLEAQKQRLAAATRALARRAKLKVLFLGEQTQAESLSLPPLTESLSGDDEAAYRGSADRAAFWLRFHDAAQHRAQRPSHHMNAQMFDMLEQVRVEMLGSEHLRGSRTNLARRFAHDTLSPGWSSEALSPAAMLELLARRHVQAMPLPARFDVAMAERNSLYAPLVAKLAALKPLQNDQKRYGAQALELIALLEDIVASQELERQPGSLSSETLERREQADEQEPEPMPASTGSESRPEASESSENEAPQAAMDAPMLARGEEEPGGAPNYPHNRVEAPPAQPYQVFTRDHDQIVSASQLATPQELEQLREQLDQKLGQFQSLVSKLAGKLQRFLLAQQARTWLFDEEEGLIDSKKLARVVVHPDYSAIYKREKDTEFRDTVVSLLIDNSGSMRGRPITMAAMCADIMSRTLERCGVKVEVLGFTTREWKGGQSYKQWMKNGRPPRPGRLNDIRHIIYKSADASWRSARRQLGLMLKDGILKENIDGEAIMWACERLLARPEQRRILMVISDGAPVDDASLSANHGAYLDKHLREVIAQVETQLPIELLAIGIGHDVTRYYKRAVTISDIDKLAQTMSDQLVALFSSEEKARATKRRAFT